MPLLQQDLRYRKVVRGRHLDVPVGPHIDLDFVTQPLDQGSVVRCLAIHLAIGFRYQVIAEDLRRLRSPQAVPVGRLLHQVTPRYHLDGVLDRHTCYGSAGIPSCDEPPLDQIGADTRPGAVVDYHPVAASQPLEAFAY